MMAFDETGTAYTYDNNGNIASMSVGGVTYTYTYDAQNQLTSVTDGTNSASYSYDNGGNITSKTVNGVTTAYGYGDTNWKDKLTSYDGQSITYDAIGNPLSYRGMTMSWTGRRLNSITNGGTTGSYLYNADGIRTKKTVGSVTTDYFLDGSTILAEKTGNNVIWYICDSDGDILGLINDGAPYYYLKNAQGDVVSIVDANNNIVGSYTYDAWGKVLSVTGSIAQINPIRYRGYYYDTETNLYYLQSRYYDPETGRFINADGLFSSGITTTNMFSYCCNNPIVSADESGHFAYNKMLRLTDKGGKFHNKVVKKASTGEKVWKTFAGILTSFSAYAGVGTGLGVDVSAGIAGVSIYSKQDFYSVEIDDGKFNTGRTYGESIGCSLAFVNLGYESCKYHSFSLSSECHCDLTKDSFYDVMGLCPDSVVSNGSSMLVSFGISVYAVAGLSIEASFDITECIDKIVVIWSD